MFIGHPTKDVANISERKGSYLVFYFSFCTFRSDQEERDETHAGRLDAIVTFL